MTNGMLAPPFDLSPFRDEYPWESHWIDLSGIRMHYLDEGAGEPLVMLHGNPTWSFFWRHLVKGLAGGYRCVVPDHIGMGLSDKPGDQWYDYTLRQRVEDLEALLDRLELTRDLTLVLHDWGGMIGLTYATRHPERVKRLVVFNTAGFGLPAGKSLPWQLALVRYLPMGFLVQGLNAFARGAAMTCSTVPGRMTPEIRKAYLAPYNSWDNRIAVHRFVQDIPLRPGDPSYNIVQEVSSHLEQLRDRPILLCWGERDFVFDYAFLDEWKRRFPDAELHTFPEAGHYVLEDAHDEILPIVKRFLLEQPPSHEEHGLAGRTVAGP